MLSLSEEEKRQVLGDVMADQLKAISEAVNEVPEIKKSLDKLSDDLNVAIGDIKIIKAAITDISRQVNNHEREINRLQTI